MTCLDHHSAKSGTSCQLTFTFSYYLSTRYRRFEVVAMANYHYDESGVMATYFVISVLFIILIPSTYSLFSSFKGSSKSPIPKSHPPQRNAGTLPQHLSLNSEITSIWLSVSTMRGSTDPDRQAGGRFIAKAENIKFVRRLLVAC